MKRNQKLSHLYKTPGFGDIDLQKVIREAIKWNDWTGEWLTLDCKVMLGQDDNIIVDELRIKKFS